MKSYTPDQVRNVVILGHSGCGKTTMMEACLFRADLLKRLGKVEEGNTVSDYDSEEIKRKVSINTSVIPIEWMDSKINFLDTPGYFDFIGEVKNAASVADAAIIMVSAKSGLEVGTEKAWEICEEFHLPRMIFINEMDDDKANFERTLSDMQEKFGKCVAPLQIPFFDAGGKVDGMINLIKRDARIKIDGKLSKCEMPEEMVDMVERLRTMIVEVAASSDDEMMEKYFNNEELTYDEIYSGIKTGIVDGSIAPVICGAAPMGYGVKLMMNSIVKFFPPSSECKPSIECIDVKTNDVTERKNDPSDHFSAYVFKTISDPYVGRLNLFRIYSGTLKKDKTIFNPQKYTYEKVSHIYVLRGKEQIEVDELKAGDIGALSKLENTSTQDTLCSKEAPVIIPKIDLPASVYSMAIVSNKKGEEDKVASALAKIKEEDPTVKVNVNTETKQTVISGVGDQQMDVIVSKLKNKYKLDISLVEPIIPFRETIRGKVKVQGKYKKQSGGHGQYGDVWMEFEPSGDLNTPYIFEEKIFGGSVPKQYFPAVEKGIQESINTGVLAGYPVVGLKAILVDGSYHPVDSSEMAFKMATSLAFKDGLTQAKPVILEPIAHVEVFVPERFMGDVMGDINKRRGRILSMDSEGNKKKVVAEVPMAEMNDYATGLRSMTQGRGSFTSEFERYEEAPMEAQKKIIEARMKK